MIPFRPVSDGAGVGKELGIPVVGEALGVLVGDTDGDLDGGIVGENDGEPLGLVVVGDWEEDGDGDG